MSKKQKKKNKNIFKTISFYISGFLLLLFFVIICIWIYMFLSPAKIESIEISDKLNQDKTVKLTINILNVSKKDNVQCSLSTNEEIQNQNTWIYSEDNKCVFNVNSGSYFIFIKDNNGKIVKEQKSVKINKILNISLNTDLVYLALTDNYKLNHEIISIGNVDKQITWKSSNEKIVSVKDGIVNALSIGEAYITASTSNKLEAKTKIIVTDLIQKAYIDENKQKLGCEEYTQEQAHTLDSILESKIKNAGYGTRAGSVAAARFLTLEFPRKIAYFFENGRLNVHSGKHYVDGEGRYFHKGLYLSTDKFESIVASFSGPSMWGCPLTNWERDYGMIYGKKYPNGFSCSGFVSWVLLNGGLKNIKDSGAGDTTYVNDDISDLGEKHLKTRELIYSGRIKAGDLIMVDGHIAFIAGIDNENYYIAESLMNTKGPSITTWSYEKLVNTRAFSHIILMDSEYESEGNYSLMW